MTICCPCRHRDGPIAEGIESSSDQDDRGGVKRTWDESFPADVEMDARTIFDAKMAILRAVGKPEAPQREPEQKAEPSPAADSGAHGSTLAQAADVRASGAEAPKSEPTQPTTASETDAKPSVAPTPSPSGPAKTNQSQTPAKKARTTPALRMNINSAVDRAYEVKSFAHISMADVAALEGIGKAKGDILNRLGVRTVRDLGHWKFYRIAKALVRLSALEERHGRRPGTVCNANRALDREHEGKELGSIVRLPPSALEGLGRRVDAEFRSLGVTSISDLGTWKFARWAEAITEMAKHEEKLS
eukprot:CAMPEP_0176058032 /NCGR_PEP_ID=MMETSP0120_2-20121206/28909_1 /TAXON_ID=160619 /ORGANISM="Kryptoperidinium foliaceum, Strain CCMP 1326" /LENGTH=301 /DNA_ID=CAMNT_0017391551 /DNA_START=46 /DNA_END=951 /DNA_ORIENTATION=-